MNRDKLNKMLPKFHDLFELPKDALQQNIEVYRYNRHGKLTNDAFLSVYEEALNGNYYKSMEDLDLSVASTYSISCFEELSDLRKIFKTKSRKNSTDKCFILKGITVAELGPSLRSKKKKSSHVDWWLIENANPIDYFEGCDCQ